MKLKRYCVTVMDNWTPTRTFWTQAGAKRFYQQHWQAGNVFQWKDGCWNWMCGAHDRGIIKGPYDYPRHPPSELESKGD